MSNYIPWYGKKRAGFKRREEQLLRMLGGGQRPEAVERAAEEVRAARIRALKSDRARIPPCGRDDNDARLRRFDEEIARWTSRTVEEIMEAYRQRRSAEAVRTSAAEDACAESSDV